MRKLKRRNRYSKSTKYLSVHFNHFGPTLLWSTYLKSVFIVFANHFVSNDHINKKSFKYVLGPKKSNLNFLSHKKYFWL